MVLAPPEPPRPCARPSYKGFNDRDINDASADRGGLVCAIAECGNTLNKY